MTADEFKKSAKRSGYGCAKSIALYIRRSQKADFTEEDFIELYRLNEHADASHRSCNGKYRLYQGTKSTKHFVNLGSDTTEQEE